MTFRSREYAAKFARAYRLTVAPVGGNENNLPVPVLAEPDGALSSANAMGEARESTNTTVAPEESRGGQFITEQQILNMVEETVGTGPKDGEFTDLLRDPRYDERSKAL